MIAPSTRKPNFSVGQLVRHRRYGYRGVIVEVDTKCLAPDDWYGSNLTQPDRFQAWYHVSSTDRTRQPTLPNQASCRTMLHSPSITRLLVNFSTRSKTASTCETIDHGQAGNERVAPTAVCFRRWNSVALTGPFRSVPKMSQTHSATFNRWGLMRQRFPQRA